MDYFDENYMIKYLSTSIWKNEKKYNIYSDLRIDICNGSITHQEIITHTNKFSNRKAAGLDPIHGELLKVYVKCW